MTNAELFHLAQLANRWPRGETSIRRESSSPTGNVIMMPDSGVVVRVLRVPTADADCEDYGEVDPSIKGTLERIPANRLAFNV